MTETHMVSVSSVLCTKEEAQEIAQRYGVGSDPVVADGAYVFIARAYGDFVSTWMVPHGTHFLIRGHLKNGQAHENPVLDKS